MINFNEALKLIESLKIDTLGFSRIFINECVGRILYDNIKAKDDNPKFDTSNMDGYAFCYDDLNLLKNDGLEIDSINKAGNSYIREIKNGKCIKTFTGSKMPINADSIAIVEQVEVKNNKIFLKDNEVINKGQHIRKKGQNYKKGDVLLKKNRIISAFDIGILAQNNNILIDVYNKPKIGILSSGDELIEIGETPKSDNFIYSSNNHILKAIVQSLGSEARLYPILEDSKENTKNAISNVLKDNDILITTGGMSKGDFDFVKEIINNFGECIFNDVKIKPGKAISYIKCKNNKHIFALPGNPTSSVISFILFGRLILQKMFGITPYIPTHKAKLLNNIDNSKDTRLEFIISNIFIKNGFYEVELKRNRLSYMINDFNGAMVIIEQKCYKKGDLVDIILLNNLLSL
ncbi:molybdopterin molybdotransferase MoeA [Helicobacter sp. MIT 14-3879]|uniref:molybdopterin molybdotransferase MoeA n=1 Tax=Helicobacter sp. MIT 14-3879 TaxID=2040649 RepID=UPI000E1E7F2E|nr:molybdopterin molybdotransferase MoeA [Helicobacter sp. MIT 14-3879]RDU64772.1 molybdopterin molybdenumtransferase MoeA [Helicobacter sp. MIT 14-3879]